MSIIFIAPIATEKYNKINNATTHVAAASNKVLSLARSTKAAGECVKIISSPILTKEDKKFYFNSLITRDDKIPIVFFKALTIKGLNRLYASIMYLAFGIKKIKNTDSVILYNFFPEYIPLAIWLFCCGNKAIIDIEDGPRTDEYTLRGVVNWLSFFTLTKFAKKEKIVASQLLNEKYSSGKGLVCYGAFRGDRKFDSKFSSKIKVLFGGSLQRETGIDLFVEALHLFSKDNSIKDFEFIITGFGEISKIVKLKNDLHDKVNIRILHDISLSEYKSIMMQSDIGLSLKLSNSSIGKTTFPSKVIELAGSGLLLISTSTSDVPLIFNDKTAFLVSPETPSALCEVLKGIYHNIDLARKVAFDGQQMIEKKFSPAAVGLSIINFTRRGKCVTKI